MFICSDRNRTSGSSEQLCMRSTHLSSSCRCLSSCSFCIRARRRLSASSLDASSASVVPPTLLPVGVPGDSVGEDGETQRYYIKKQFKSFQKAFKQHYSFINAQLRGPSHQSTAGKTCWDMYRYRKESWKHLRLSFRCALCRSCGEVLFEVLN